MKMWRRERVIYIKNIMKKMEKIEIFEEEEILMKS